MKRRWRPGPYTPYTAHCRMSMDGQHEKSVFSFIILTFCVVFVLILESFFVLSS